MKIYIAQYKCVSYSVWNGDKLEVSNKYKNHVKPAMNVIKKPFDKNSIRLLPSAPPPNFNAYFIRIKSIKTLPYDVPVEKS